MGVESILDYSPRTDGFEKGNEGVSKTYFSLQGDGRKKKDEYFMAPEVSFSCWKSKFQVGCIFGMVEIKVFLAMSKM